MQQVHSVTRVRNRLGRVAGVLTALIAGTIAWAEPAAATGPSLIGSALPPWTPGVLDIHQIATGRGNAALIVGPDGTSLLIDAGTASGNAGVTPAMPDDSRRPGEWIARYVQRHLAATRREQLDYFVATHLHPDHIGDIGTNTPPSSREPSYMLTGVTDVAEAILIDTVIDRGFPDYSYPTRWPAGFARNYFAFIDSRQKAGKRNERVRVGSADQIQLRYAADQYPSFVVRNIAANGIVWTGHGNATSSAVPALKDLAQKDYPDENMCSIALRLSYGSFDYFTGGDMHCDTYMGDTPWRDIETPASRVTGPVEVAVANHHGYFDAVGAESVRALQPLVWVVPAWHITHLNMGVLERMLSERLYPGPREVLATDLLPATALLNQRFMAKVKSTSGHIIIRVAPGGKEFRVYITDNRDEADTVKAIFGPFVCR